MSDMAHDKQFSVSIRDTTGQMSRMFVDCFGSGGYFIEVNGANITFDWSEQFGPLPTTRTGAERRMGHKHAFWWAASLWDLQGQRLEGKKAVWHEPKQPVLKHIGGKHYLVIEPGEEGCDW